MSHGIYLLVLLIAIFAGQVEAMSYLEGGPVRENIGLDTLPGKGCLVSDTTTGPILGMSPLQSD